ncbi:hypothetical protein [Plastoroseomonas arctica]|uniref:Uncharacterized protein n=1 Tax=Plastoroseomonas arctica TaxID=1509237 RepID=A0AAF1K2I7_9PROT|nr:hypothetical protein [Plastoroseomonas arctica]MBR0654860.1 hypothetical protein [Plastoroseomonas arctica]
MSGAIGQRGLAVIILSGCLVPLLPVALIPLPPLLDYPNHLARLWLIAGGAAGTPLEHVYAVDWSLAWVNIGIDLIARGLSPVVGHGSIGRLCIALAMLLPALGFVLLGRIIAGQWHPLLLLGPLLSANALLALGFLNHQISVGLALLFATADTIWRAGPWVKSIPRVVAGALIAIVHPFGAFAYATVLACLSVGILRPSRPGFVVAMARAALAAAPALAAVIILAAMAPHLPGGDPRTTTPGWVYDIETKFIGFLFGIVSYDPAWEIVLAAILGWFVVLGGLRMYLHAHWGLLIGVAGCACLILILPSNIGDGGQMEIRFAGLTILLASLALLPRPSLHAISAPLAAALFLLISARSVYVFERWSQGAQNLAAVEAVLADLPLGASLLPVHVQFGRNADDLKLLGVWSTSIHFPTRAIPLRHSFVPNLFSAVGKQPIRVLPPWFARSAPDGVLPDPYFLTVPMFPELARAFPYLADWRANFDHVLLVDAAGVEMQASGLALVADTGFARLYRVTAPNP